MFGHGLGVAVVERIDVPMHRGSFEVGTVRRLSLLEGTFGPFVAMLLKLKSPARRFLMIAIANRLALIVAAVLLLVAIATSMSPAVSKAAECGEGTVYDAPSDTCVVVAQPPPPPALPPPPPPPPVWYGPSPYVSVSICAPLRFVHICAGI